MSALADDLLPVYDVSDAVGVVVEADSATTWRALMEVDLIELGRRRPLVGVLGATRALPDIAAHLYRGEPLARPPERMRLRDSAGMPAGSGGWTILGERAGQELALGLVGRFWLPVIKYADVPPDRFRDFAEPGYAKTVYALSARPLGEERTFLSAVMRTATTDDSARRRFRRYWTLGVGSGAHVLVHALLEAARADAESGRPARAPS